MQGGFAGKGGKGRNKAKNTHIKKRAHKKAHKMTYLYRVSLQNPIPLYCTYFPAVGALSVSFPFVKIFPVAGFHNKLPSVFSHAFPPPAIDVDLSFIRLQVHD